MDRGLSVARLQGQGQTGGFRTRDLGPAGMGLAKHGVGIHAGADPAAAHVPGGGQVFHALRYAAHADPGRTAAAIGYA